MNDLLELDMEPRWVVRQLRASGRTQADLARYLNLTPPQINRRLKGTVRITAAEAELIREFLRAPDPQPALPPPSGMQPQRLQPVDASITEPLRSDRSRSLPIYGSVSVGGRLFAMERPVDWALKPRRLDGRDDVFSLYVDDSAMFPAFEPGEAILVESARPPGPGDNVVVHLKSDKTLLKRLVAMGADSVQLRQHNPPQDFDIPREDIAQIWRVMKINDLLTG